MGAAGWGAGLGSLANIGTTALMYKMYNDRNNPAATPATPDNPVVTSGEAFAHPKTVNETTGSAPVLAPKQAPVSATDVTNMMKRYPSQFAGQPKAIQQFFNQHNIAVRPNDIQHLSQEMQDLVDIEEARRKAALSRPAGRDSAGTSAGLTLQRPVGDF